MEEALIHRAALDEPERAGVGVRKNRLGAVCGAGDRAEPMCNFVERLVPIDALEAALALFPDPAKRMHQALIVIRSLDVAIDLGAEEAACERMLGITGNANGTSVANGHEHGARVGAVVRTGAADDRVAGVVVRAGRFHSLTIRQRGSAANGRNIVPLRRVVRTNVKHCDAMRYVWLALSLRSSGATGECALHHIAGLNERQVRYLNGAASLDSVSS